MNLWGWDMISAIEINIVNQALEAERESLITHFDHFRGGVRIRGQFGPWRILPSTARHQLTIRLFIREGIMEGITAEQIILNGLHVDINVPLTLARTAGDKPQADLSFAPGKPADMPSENTLQSLIQSCLSENAPRIGFVFARVPCATADASCLNWASLLLADGRHYLAVFAADRAPSPAMHPERIDPDRLGADGSAFVACSGRRFLARYLVPWCNEYFTPPATFRATAGGVEAITQPEFRPLQSPIGPLTPVLSRFRTALSKAGVTVSATFAIGMGADTTMIVDGAFTLDLTIGPNGRVRPEQRKPAIISHRFEGIAKRGWTLTALAGLGLKAAQTSIEEISAQLCANLPIPGGADDNPVIWTGARQFVATDVTSGGHLVLADTRPA